MRRERSRSNWPISGLVYQAAKDAQTETFAAQVTVPVSVL